MSTILNPNVIDETGKQYGRLKVLSYEDGKWKCQCDCGNTTYVTGTNLRTGNTRSCGCYKEDALMERNHMHGMSHTKIHQVWCGMLARCYRKKHTSYKHYGGRGITVIDEWHEFLPFCKWALANGYKEGLSIDRIDVDKGYSSDNCRWVDSKTQGNNKRNNDYVTINGETKTITEWCEIYNIPPNTVYARKNRSKWSEDRWFEPVDNSNKPKIITIDGETKTLQEWCRYYDINPGTVFSRIKKGWDKKDWFISPKNVGRHHERYKASDN